MGLLIFSVAGVGLILNCFGLLIAFYVIEGSLFYCRNNVEFFFGD